MPARESTHAPDLDPLVGRDAQLVAISQRLLTARLVSLTGPGGSGKTRLAEAVVAQYQTNDTDAWFVAASAVVDPELIPATIATALRLEADGSQEPFDAVIAALADRDVLLALDNLEQVADAGSAVSRLLGAAPRLRLLATSRTRLNVRGEVEFAVPALDLPADDSPIAVEESAAGSLFLARARASGRLHDIDTATAADIAAVLRRLDGLPLALELAAARTRVLSPGELLGRLDSHGIGAIDAASSDPHRSLTRIIEWSRNLLAADERAVLEAVSVAAGFDLAMAEALAPGVDVLGAIDALISVGLVRSVGQAGRTTRFRVLEPVRSEVLAGSSQATTKELRDRHADAVVAAVEDHLRGDAKATTGAGDWLDAEADNIRLALDHFDRVDPSRGLELWNTLFYPFWAVRARLREGMARFERTAALVDAPTTSLSRAMVRYAMNRRWISDESSTRQAITRALEIARLVGDRASEIESLVTLGATAINLGDLELATLVRDGLARIDDAGEPPHVRMRIAEGRHHVAAVLEGITSEAALGHLIDAIGHAEPAIEPRTEAALRGNLALCYLHRGEFRLAVEAGERTVEIARQVQSPLLPWALATLAMALAEAGIVDRAIATLGETITETLAREMAVQTLDTVLAAMPVALAAGQPLVVARLWGAAEALEASDETDIPPDDRRLAEGTVARARSRSQPMDIELAIRDGAAADSVELLRGLPVALTQARTARAAPVVRHGELTRREVEVLGLIGEGRSDAQIGEALYISTKTASVHVANVRAKLGAESRLEVALKARELGLVTAPERPRTRN